MSALPQEKLVFHHVGIACADVEEETAHYLALGYARETEIFTDETQRIRGLFMTNGGFRIELLEPAGENSPLTGYLARGVQMYHHAYEAPEFSATIRRLEEAGHRIVVPPVFAVAFKRKICFLMLTNRSLIELIEPPAVPRP